MTDSLSAKDRGLLIDAAEARGTRVSALERQLNGYRLTTAEIIYHMPDHPHLLQSFTWQQLDLAPRYPELRRFLDFWDREIEAALHSVKVGATTLITPGELTHKDASLTLH
jgi:uncharacterized protein Usg